MKDEKDTDIPNTEVEANEKDMLSLYVIRLSFFFSDYLSHVKLECKVTKKIIM